jgi:hypothetical protein
MLIRIKYGGGTLLLMRKELLALVAGRAQAQAHKGSKPQGPLGTRDQSRVPVFLF